MNDLQMAPLALPDMAVGENTFTYSDQTPGTREVRITHEWVERSASRPPAASEALYPPDGGESDGTDIVFKWTVPADPEEDGMSDYQFELSRRPDVRFPLSMSFYKLSSRTLDASRAWTETGWKFSQVKPQYTLSEPGLLTPDTKYYWHVRAMNARGVWGPWSKTATFTARRAACPLNLRVDWDGAKGVDERDKRSGPSDYAVGPRPVIYSKPLVRAKVGQEYKHEVRANRSLGDLSARIEGGNQVGGYFDLEKPKFALLQGPAWLRMDEAAGILSGTPTATGRAEVTVSATIDRPVRKLDEKALIWGREQVFSTATEQAGTATQKFVIEVQ